MERGEGPGSIGNGLDRGRGVGNSLDREHVDVVVDDRDQSEHKPTTAMAMAMVTAKQQSHTVLGVGAERGSEIATTMTMVDVSGSNMTSNMLDAQDNTINNKWCCCCRKRYT